MDVEGVHQPLRTDNALPHPRRRLVHAIQHIVQVRNSRTGIANTNDQSLGLVHLEQKFHLTVLCVSECVARHLRGRSGHTDLILTIEAECSGYISSSLSRLNHVTFSAQAHGSEWL